MADGALTIYDAKWNIVVEKVPFGGPGDYVFPQKTRGYIVPVPGSLEPGRYSAAVEMKYDTKGTMATTEYFFDAKMR